MPGHSGPVFNWPFRCPVQAISLKVTASICNVFSRGLNLPSRCAACSGMTISDQQTSGLFFKNVVNTNLSKPPFKFQWLLSKIWVNVLNQVGHICLHTFKCIYLANGISSEYCMGSTKYIHLPANIWCYKIHPLGGHTQPFIYFIQTRNVWTVSLLGDDINTAGILCNTCANMIYLRTRII